ncbi:hypothetical protein [Pedobacter caeni]|uniref:Uncharacterized protein n=1 Tax=Pedobacter caeni TaxID=288992 RepID=A0A1M5A6E6_9SPHI|nr:hypothetical protein [Pedobacter caeni]SHF25402.1 hypothetical protein SAMN04488522_102592 [Pedobacter caeni]
MKPNHYLLLNLLIVTMILTSCKKNNIEHENDFDKSFKAWTDFKASSDNSYHYTVSTVSWTGLSTETQVTVKNGKPIQRSYLAKSVRSTPKNEVTIHEQWTEDEAKLNTHPNQFKAVTLDEIYQKAKTVWLLKKKNAKSYLETKNNGMISSCGYIEENCADDCFVGINIESIVAGL